jgi:hypothetical protein
MASVMNEERRGRACRFFAWALLIGCGPDEASPSDADSGADSADTDTPETCPDATDSQTSVEYCNEYYFALQCCGLWSPSKGEVDPASLCSARFMVDSNGDTVSPACPGLISEIIDCAILVGTMSCNDLSSFQEGIRENVGPPSDMDMPCYSEAIAAYDAGCEPYLR